MKLKGYLIVLLLLFNVVIFSQENNEYNFEDLSSEDIKNEKSEVNEPEKEHIENVEKTNNSKNSFNKKKRCFRLF